MAGTLADQLVIARQTIEEQRRKREEEYQKDLEALERVARFLPAGSAPSQVNRAQVAIEVLSASKDRSAEEEERSSDSDTPSLISAVLGTVLSRPNASLSPRMVLESLEAQNFPFTRDNGKRILSVAQSLRKLTERDQPQVRLIRRGSGRRPNLYGAVIQEINPAHVTTAARSGEMTM
jgi:hypothetical protein